MDKFKLNIFQGVALSCKGTLAFATMGWFAQVDTWILWEDAGRKKLIPGSSGRMPEERGDWRRGDPPTPGYEAARDVVAGQSQPQERDQGVRLREGRGSGSR